MCSGSGTKLNMPQDSSSSAAISVVMPMYNAEDTIRDSIESVLAQTFEDFELLVIDDCSKDNGAKIVQNFAGADSRVKLLQNVTNQGVAHARNIGVDNARGAYVAFLDSDDLWHKQKLEKQVALMKEANAVISYTGTAYMDAVGRRYNYVLQAEPVLAYKDLLKRNIMSCSSVMVCRDVMARMKFASGYLHEDYAAWLRILRKVGYAYGLNEPLLVYRVSSQSKSGGLFRSGLMNYCAYRQVGYGKVLAGMLSLRYAWHSVPKRIQIKCMGGKQG